MLTEGEITKPASQLAAKISSDKHDHQRILIAIPRGAFIFPSGLIRHLTIQVKPKITSNGVTDDYYL
jgi:hypoxanthine-guanine phosphoribosyltransferase